MQQELQPPPTNNPDTYAVPDTPDGAEPLLPEHHYIAGLHSDSDQVTPEQPLSSEHYSWQELGEEQAIGYFKENADQDIDQDIYQDVEQDAEQSQGTMLPFFSFFGPAKEDAGVHGEDQRGIIQETMQDYRDANGGPTDQDREECRMIGQLIQEDDHTIEPYDEAIHGDVSRTRTIDLIQNSIIEEEEQFQKKWQDSKMSLSYTEAEAEFKKSQKKKFYKEFSHGMEEKRAKSAERVKSAGRSKSAEPPRQRQVTPDEKMNLLLEEQKTRKLKLEQERVKFVLEQQRNQPHPLDQAVNPPSCFNTMNHEDPMRGTSLNRGRAGRPENISNDPIQENYQGFMSAGAPPPMYTQRSGTTLFDQSMAGFNTIPVFPISENNEFLPARTESEPAPVMISQKIQDVMQHGRQAKSHSRSSSKSYTSSMMREKVSEAVKEKVDEINEKWDKSNKAMKEAMQKQGDQMHQLYEMMKNQKIAENQKVNHQAQGTTLHYHTKGNHGPVPHVVYPPIPVQSPNVPGETMRDGKNAYGSIFDPTLIPKNHREKEAPKQQNAPQNPNTKKNPEYRSNNSHHDDGFATNPNEPPKTQDAKKEKNNYENTRRPSMQKEKEDHDDIESRLQERARILKNDNAELERRKKELAKRAGAKAAADRKDKEPSTPDQPSKTMFRPRHDSFPENIPNMSTNDSEDIFHTPNGERQKTETEWHDLNAESRQPSVERKILEKMKLAKIQQEMIDNKAEADLVSKWQIAPIVTLKLPKDREPFKRWRSNFLRTICGSSPWPEKTLQWLKSVKHAANIDVLGDEPSDFKFFSTKLAVALMDLAAGDLGKKLKSIAERKIDEDKFLTARQVIFIIYEEYDTRDHEDTMFDYEDLKDISLINEDLVAFINEWEDCVYGMSVRLGEGVLLSLFEKQVKTCKHFKMAYEHYKHDIVHEGKEKSYEALIKKCREHILGQKKERSDKDDREKLAAKMRQLSAPESAHIMALHEDTHAQGRFWNEDPPDNKRGCFQWNKYGSCAELNQTGECPFEAYHTKGKAHCEAHLIKSRKFAKPYQKKPEIQQDNYQRAPQPQHAHNAQPQAQPIKTFTPEEIAAYNQVAMLQMQQNQIPIQPVPVQQPQIQAPQDQQPRNPQLQQQATAYNYQNRYNQRQQQQLAYGPVNNRQAQNMMYDPWKGEKLPPRNTTQHYPETWQQRRQLNTPNGQEWNEYAGQQGRAHTPGPQSRPQQTHGSVPTNPSMMPTTNQRQQVCKDWMVGKCSKANMCQYFHPTPCRFFSFGRCTKGEKCEYAHDPATIKHRPAPNTQDQQIMVAGGAVKQEDDIPTMMVVMPVSPSDQ